MLVSYPILLQQNILHLHVALSMRLNLKQETVYCLK